MAKFYPVYTEFQAHRSVKHNRESLLKVYSYLLEQEQDELADIVRSFCQIPDMFSTALELQVAGQAVELRIRDVSWSNDSGQLDEAGPRFSQMTARINADVMGMRRSPLGPFEELLQKLDLTDGVQGLGLST